MTNLSEMAPDPGLRLIWGVDPTAPQLVERIKFLLVRTPPDSQDYIYHIQEFDRAYGFFHRLFALSAMEHRVYTQAAQISSRLPVTVDEDDWAYGQIVEYVWDVNSRVQKRGRSPRKTMSHGGKRRRDSERYTGVPIRLRRSLSSLFYFKTVKRKKTLSFQIPPESVLFVSCARLQGLVPAGKKAAPVSTVPPIHGADLQPPELLAEIGEEARIAHGPRHWLDLYHMALRHVELPNHLIELSAVSPPTTDDPRITAAPPAPTLTWATHATPIPIVEAAATHKNLILTGRAGAGKTTVLNALLDECLTRNASLPAACRYLPFLVPLRYLGHLARSQKSAELLAESAVSTLGCLPLEQLSRWEALGRDDRLQKAAHPRAQMSHRALLERFGTAVLSWLESNRPLDDHVLIVIDGLNEMSRPLRGYVSSSLEELSRTDARIVLTSRAWPQPEVPNSFAHLQICDLEDRQIRIYLDKRFQGRGSSIFDHQIKGYARFLALARVPFFLSLIGDSLSPTSAMTCNPTEAALLNTFVQKSASRKMMRDRVPLPNISEETRNRFLAEFAEHVMKRITQSGQRSLVFPRDVEDLPAGGHTLDDLVRLCEMLGIIRLIHVGAAGGSQVEFSHDYFLYFFAAKHLLSIMPHSLIQDIKTYLDFAEWDLPLCLYLQLSEDPRLNKDFLSRVSHLDREFALLCATDARISNQTIEEFLTESGPTDVPPCSPLLSPAEVCIVRTPARPILLARLPRERIEELTKAKGPLLASAIESIPFAWGSGALEYIAASYAKASPARRRLLLDSCRHIQSLDCLAFVLQCFDQEGDSSRFSPSPSLLAAIIQPLSLPASDVWTYATNYERELLLGRSLSILCYPVETDTQLLLQLLDHIDAGVAERAAILLIRLQGNGALPRVEPALTRARRIPYGNSYGIVRAIAELNTPEASNFLLHQLMSEPAVPEGFHPRLPFVARLLQSKEALAELLRRALSIPDMLRHPILEKTTTPYVIETLDALTSLSTQTESIRCLADNFSPWKQRHRLLAGCLHDRRQRGIVMEAIRKAGRAHWYANSITPRRGEVKGRGKEPRRADRLADVSSESVSDDSLQGFFDAAFRADNALIEAKERRSELVLAARAARVLQITDVRNDLRSLADTTDKGEPLYLEALTAVAALGGIGQPEVLFQELRAIPHSMPMRSSLMRNIIEAYLDSLDDRQLPKVLRALYIEHLDSLIEEDDRPGKTTYLVHGIQRAVRRIPSDEPLLQSIVAKVSEAYRHFADKKDEHMQEGMLLLLHSIQEAAGRRFLNALHPAEQK